MAKIIALGGGNKRRTKFSVEAFDVDQEIVKLSGKSKPRLLFIPTASSDLDDYIQDINSHFGKKLGCRVETLYLVQRELSKREIRKKILQSDIIFVGGGNTLKMMKLWRRLGIDKFFKEALKKNIVLSGTSAGGICWFKYGLSNSRRYSNPKADLMKVRGLDFVSLSFCPHYNRGKKRKRDLKKIMKKSYGIAIAVDDRCAIEIVDDKYRIISSKNNANTYKVYWKNNKYFQEKLEKTEHFRELKGLFKKI